MKRFLLAFSFMLLLPLPCQAIYLLNCDSNPAKVLVLSDGLEGDVTLAEGDVYTDYGPVVSFQVQGISPVMLSKPEEKFCIWKAKLTHKIMCRANKMPKVLNGMIMMH